MKDPLVLWNDLKERYENKKFVILPKVRYNWLNLRLQDFKSVSEYNSALFKIILVLKLRGGKNHWWRHVGENIYYISCLEYAPPATISRAYEALRCKLEAESQNNTSKLWNSLWNSFSISIISFNKRIQSELEKILESLKNIIEKQNELGLKKVVGGVTLRSPRLTTSCPEKCGVFGRDIDKEAIFKFWQLNDASSDGICVVPIVGMGGIGKQHSLSLYSMIVE